VIDHETWFPAICLGLGAVVGFTDLLRSRRPLGWRRVVSAILWHGLASLGTALALSEQIQNRLILYGVAIGTSSGAYSISDLLIAGLRARLSQPGRTP
jgi:hypothetical protein